MAFTHDHINAFVIVGGDSDFISLVEKLKQYGRKVIVVGGRQFTSATMQKNCHEFIAYENLTSSRGRSAERGGKPGGTTAIAQALPLVKRALKVLSEREVTPQLGLLKSTLLQLDSTFSERDYGASSFRDFMEKVAQSGAVTLKHAGRSMLVESREDGPSDVDVMATPPERPVHHAPVPDHAPLAPTPAAAVDESDEEEALPSSPMSMQDGIRAVQQAFTQAAAPPRWPMYVRQAKQYLRNAIEGFDERKYGFASVVDLLRAAGKENVVRIERDRQGAVRVFPGVNLGAPPQPSADAAVMEAAEYDLDQETAGDPADDSRAATDGDGSPDAVTGTPIVEAGTVAVSADLKASEDAPDTEESTEDEVDGNRADVAPVARGARKRRAPGTRAQRPARASKAKTARPRARKTTPRS
jgi:hypothetical protein